MSDKYPRVYRDPAYGFLIERSEPEKAAYKVVPADAIVIERSELPEVADGPHGPCVPSAPEGLGDFRLREWQNPRERGLILLALAEWNDSHPPVDEAEVDALSSLVTSVSVKDHPEVDAVARIIARRLVERGVRVTEDGAR